MEAGSIQFLVVSITLPILALVLFLPHAGGAGRLMLLAASGAIPTTALLAPPCLRFVHC